MARTQRLTYVYEVTDHAEGETIVFRNLGDALTYYHSIEFATLAKVGVRVPVNKDTLVACLNREGYAAKYKQLRAKGH